MLQVFSCQAMMPAVNAKPQCSIAIQVALFAKRAANHCFALCLPEAIRGMRRC